MNKWLTGIGIFCALLLIGGTVLLTKKDSNTPTTSTVSQITQAPPIHWYFWGDGCPHCKKVQDFMDSWENKDKFQLEKFETWYNKENAQKMAAVASFCQLPKEQTGVPLLFITDGKCIIGDEPIIEYLKGLTFTTESTDSAYSR